MSKMKKCALSMLLFCLFNLIISSVFAYDNCEPYDLYTNPNPVLPCSYNGYDYDSLAVESGLYVNSFFFKGANYILNDYDWYWSLESQVNAPCDGLIFMEDGGTVNCSHSLGFNKSGALFFGVGASYTTPSLPFTSPFYGAVCGSSTLYFQEMAHFIDSNGEEWVYYMPTCADGGCGPWMQENIPSGIYKWPVSGGYTVQHAAAVYPYRLVAGSWVFQNCTQSSVYITDLIALSEQAVNPFDLSDTWSANTTFGPAVVAPLHNENGLIMTTSQNSTFASYEYFLDFSRQLNHDGSDLALTSDGSLTYSQDTVGRDVHAICEGTVLDVRCDRRGLLGSGKSTTCKVPDSTWMKVRHSNCGGRDVIAYYGHIENVPTKFTKTPPDPVHPDDVLGSVMQYTRRSGHLHLTLDTDTQRDLTSPKYEMCEFLYDYDNSYPGCTTSTGKCVTNLSNCVPSSSRAKLSKGQILLFIGWGRATTERYVDNSGKTSTRPLYISPDAMRDLGFIDFFDIY